MANWRGAKGNRGGSKARTKNYLAIDFSNFAAYAEKLDQLGADLQKIIGDAMEQAAETVEWDTVDAVAKANLPAKGQYSRGDTEDSIIRGAKAQWSGSLGEIHIGFDKSKPGAGGFLTTGTPRMAPDYALEKMYIGRKYATTIKKQIEEQLQEELDSLGGGE